MRRFLFNVALLAGAIVMTGFDCGSSGGSGSAGPPVVFSHPNGNVTVSIARDPFALTISDAAGNVLLESTSAHDAQSTDPADAASEARRAYAPLALTHDTDTSVQAPMKGWDSFRGEDDPWQRSTHVTSASSDASGVTLAVATDGGATATLRIEARNEGLHLLLKGAPASGGADINRVSLGFKMHDDGAAPGDHFLGFGERFVRSDHKGQKLYTWVEDGGFGHGEDTPPGPANPSPNGEGQTNMPIPWFLSPRGFGLFLDGSFRSVYHLGEEASDAWRFESWADTLDATLFVDPDPKKLVESLTAITGRPPKIADWVLAPRRRADPGTDEVAKLRAAHIPTSVIDLDVHYFPNGGGSDSTSMKAMTADMHKRGFKAVAYFCPFIADSWTDVFNEAASKGYFVKHADGTPYTVLDPPYNAGMIDFTNPDAVAWYQAWLTRALDDGWDGWMYDFAEYVPMDAVMANGMTGMQAHNLYPVLYQKAAFDLLEQKRPADYLIFVRSGFSGTGGKVPMVWAGDQNTDFDLADGLPAALTGALNAGMSGVPLWGSDISGYHFIYNPPPDKEVYLRWTEVGAFSADMHDENEGAGSPPLGAADRWQIWKDQDSTDTYRKYASYKTRMLPYVKLAVADARAHGTPVMRHLFLDYPRDPKVWTISDEYMYGSALLVAPVVARGQTTKHAYLPEGEYFDFWSGSRVTGGGFVDLPAPLDVVPVLAKKGAIVPMLHPDVETVVPSTDGSVVSAADRADYLEVAVFAGGSTQVTLDDGTELSQSAPAQAFAPGAAKRSDGSTIAAAASAADLQSCDACVWDDAANHVWSVAIKTQSDSITAGALTLAVKNAPSVKRFVFTVRH